MFVIGEANFSDHGANRLGASALMQGLADGYFIVPYTIGDYLARTKGPKVLATHAAFKDAVKGVTKTTDELLAVKGKRTVDSFHRELGKLLWEHCGMARNEAGLTEALEKIPRIREQFREDLVLPGTGAEMNQELEKAGRVADFLDLGELMCFDARERRESCGGHFREEYVETEGANKGEAKRDDEAYCYAAAWEYKGPNERQALHKEPLSFENVHLTQRDYK
jgi:succinate dehydrogenase / fumarate reductase flavoprotein subunit